MSAIGEKRDQLVAQWMVPYAMQALMMVYFQHKDGIDVNWTKIGLYLLATYASTKLFFDVST